jgi:hypothetical protein
MHALRICQERSERLDHPGIHKLAKFGNIRCPPADILSSHYSTRLHAASIRCLFLCTRVHMCTIQCARAVCVCVCVCVCARARTHTHTNRER